jgi:hypothetical protein
VLSDITAEEMSLLRGLQKLVASNGEKWKPNLDVSIFFMEKDIKNHKQTQFQHVKGAFFQLVARSKAESPPKVL